MEEGCLTCSWLPLKEEPEVARQQFGKAGKVVAAKAYQVSTAAQRSVKFLDGVSQSPFDAGGRDAADIDMTGAVDQRLEVGAEVSRGGGRQPSGVIRMERTNQNTLCLLRKVGVMYEGPFPAASLDILEGPQENLALGGKRPPRITKEALFAAGAIVLQTEERGSLEEVTWLSAGNGDALRPPLMHVAVQAEVKTVRRIN